MKFLLGMLWRLAYVCVLAFRPTTDPRHRRACPCVVAARRVGKMRTRCPRQRRSRRVAPFNCSMGWRGHTPWSAVYEASPLPALSDVAVSQRFSTESHPCASTSPATDSFPDHGVNGLFLKLTLLRRASEDASAAPAPGRLDRDDWAAENRTPSVTKSSPSCIPTFRVLSRGSLNSALAFGSW